MHAGLVDRPLMRRHPASGALFGPDAEIIGVDGRLCVGHCSEGVLGALVVVSRDGDRLLTLTADLDTLDAYAGALRDLAARMRALQAGGGRA